MGPVLWLVGLISEWLTALGNAMIMVSPFAFLFLAMEGYYGRGFRFQWLWSIMAAVFLVKTSGLVVEYLIVDSVTTAISHIGAPYYGLAHGFRRVWYDPNAAKSIEWAGFSSP